MIYPGNLGTRCPFLSFQTINPSTNMPLKEKKMAGKIGGRDREVGDGEIEGNGLLCKDWSLTPLRLIAHDI